MTCDDFQIAFDQRSAGAESAVPAAELDAHLASCETCGAYASLSRKLSTAMSTTIALAPAPLDLDSMRARIATLTARARRYARMRPLVLAGVAIVSTALLWLDRQGAPNFSVATVLVNVANLAWVTALMYWVTGREMTTRLRELAALQFASDQTLVAGYRAQLDLRIRTRSLLGLLTLIGGWQAYQYGREGHFGRAGLAGVIAVIGLISLFQALHLRRERAALG